jgi:hypothetical protein
MAVAIPLALMAASAAAGAAANRKTKKAADSTRQLAAEGRQNFLQRNQDNLNSLFGHAQGTYGMPERQGRWDAAATRMDAARNADLAAAPAQPTVSGSGTNAAQLAYAGTKTAEEGQRMRDVVSLMSKAAAPANAGFDESMGNANFASDYGNRADNARQMLKAFGVDTEERAGKIKTAGSNWQLMSDLFAKGAAATSGGMLSGAAMAIPKGYANMGVGNAPRGDW